MITIIISSVQLRRLWCELVTQNPNLIQVPRSAALPQTPTCSGGDGRASPVATRPPPSVPTAPDAGLNGRSTS